MVTIFWPLYYFHTKIYDFYVGKEDDLVAPKQPQNRPSQLVSAEKGSQNAGISPGNVRYSGEIRRTERWTEPAKHPNQSQHKAILILSGSSPLQNSLAMRNTISQAQLEVWEWKEKAAGSLSHLPTMAEKIAEIRRRTQRAAAILNSQLPAGEQIIPPRRP